MRRRYSGATSWVGVCWLCLAVLGCCILLPCGPIGSVCQAQVPERVNYQGRLLNGTNLVNGEVSLELRLYDASGDGTLVFADSNDVTVVDGLYSVQMGENVLSGSLSDAVTNAELWLETVIDGAVLAPRERVGAVCYSLMAGGVTPGGITGEMLADAAVGPAALAPGAVTGEAIGDGSVSNVDLAADAVTGGKIVDGTVTAADVDAATFSNMFWKVDGNAGTTPGTHFIGTADDQPLELHANGLRVLRLEPDPWSPNVVGGHSANTAIGQGIVIAGGGMESAPNRVSGVYSVIGGGRDNTVHTNADWAVIDGGLFNTVHEFADMVTIGGGEWHVVESFSSDATIGGGAYNHVGLNADAAVVAGGDHNSVGHYADYSAIGGGQANLVASNAMYGFVGGGFQNWILTNTTHGVIGGGNQNMIGPYAHSAVIGGGRLNEIYSFSEQSLIAGGLDNAIGVGAQNSCVGGGHYNILTQETDYDVIAGGDRNAMDPFADYSAIGGGRDNRVGRLGQCSVIGGGRDNKFNTNVTYGVIAGGEKNSLDGHAHHSAVGGGYSNTIGFLAWHDVIGGGKENSIGDAAECSVIGGGSNNTISADAIGAVIPGGGDNVASRPYTFAAGKNARAVNDGSFVWSDSYNDHLHEVFESDGSHQFKVRAFLGAYFTDGGYDTNSALWVELCHFKSRPIDTHTGAYLSDTGIWQDNSDRDLKENFTPVDKRAVLERVAALPVTTWNYKVDPASRHIGPTAQDFHETFKVGEDDRHLGAIDTSGVALSAIQGLYDVVKEKDAVIDRQQTELDDLRKRLEALESCMRP